MYVGSNHEITASITVYIHLAKNLGDALNSDLSMSEHINAVCKKAFYEIRNIGQSRNFLDDKTAIALVHAFVSSHAGLL